MMPTRLTAISDEQLKAFPERAKDALNLQERLQAANTADAVVTIPKAEGFVISAEYLKQPPAEMTEQELESGAATTPPQPASGAQPRWRATSSVQP
jgi:predicted ribosomally synthesized peptide with nif11-like leader